MKLKELSRLNEVLFEGNYDLNDLDVDKSDNLEPIYPKKISGYFDCQKLNLKSFLNFPEHIDGYLSVYSNPISTIEHAPMYVGKYVELTNTNISSLQGIGRQCFKHIGTKLLVGGTRLSSHMLGVLLIEGLNNIESSQSKWDDDDDLDKVCHHLNIHLETDRDVMECQEELIHFGFKNYARL